MAKIESKMLHMQSPQTMRFFLTRPITGAKMSCWRGPLVGITYLPELG